MKYKNFDQIIDSAFELGQSSGKTIADFVINTNYKQLLEICNKITHNINKAEELLHITVEHFYLYYDLNKISSKGLTEQRYIYYLNKLFCNGYYCKNSNYNKKYNKSDLEYIDNIPQKIEIIDDTEEVRVKKTLDEIKIKCMYDGIDSFDIKPIHRKIFYKFLFEEIIIKGRNCNVIAKELGVPKKNIYLNFNDLKRRIEEYYQKKCKNINI